MSDFEKEAFVKINCERKDWWVEDTWMPSAAWLEHSHYKVQVCGEEMGEEEREEEGERLTAVLPIVYRKVIGFTVYLLKFYHS